MKTFTIPTILLACLFLFSCSREMITPADVGGAPELAASGPGNPCGSAVVFGLREISSIISRGEVAISNDEDFVYVEFGLNHGWVMTEAFLFAGASGNVPVDGNGDADVESFNHPIVLTRPENVFVYKMPKSGMANCTDFVLWAEIAQIDQFGTIYNITETMFDGSPLLNLMEVRDCLDAC